MDFCREWITVPTLLFSLDMQNWRVKRIFPTSLEPDVGHGTHPTRGRAGGTYHPGEHPGPTAVNGRLHALSENNPQFVLVTNGLKC